MKIEIEIILKHLKEQHEFRRELQECGNSEVSESWDTLKWNIEQEIKSHTDNYTVDTIDLIRAA